MRDIRKIRRISGDAEYPVLAITLSNEMRKVMGWKEGDRVMLVSSTQGIIITKEKEKETLGAKP